LLEPLNPVLLKHYIMIAFLLQSPSNLIHCSAYPLIEVGNLIVEESLKELHFSLNISEVALVYLVKDPCAGIPNCIYRLFFDFKDLISDCTFEILKLLLMNNLALKL